jgi:hypothetical protein
MAVGIRIKLPGVTQEQFDQVNSSSERVGLPRWRTANDRFIHRSPNVGSAVLSQ